MTKTLAKIIIIIFVLVQLPFTIVGLSLTVGLLRDGAEYLLVAYYAAIDAGLGRDNPLEQLAPPRPESSPDTR